MTATAFMPDLDAYFARIGHAGSRKPTLATLRALHLAHARAIPFENLDVLLGLRISLEPEAVERKLVGARRGGYCFEQNTLFGEVLAALGFRVTPLLARVRRNVPPEVRSPLTHKILRLEIEGRPWLADVGFGAVGTTAPLRLDTPDPQPTPLEPHRFVPHRGGLLHQALLGDEWVDVYEFTFDEPAPLDFEVGNWFSCTHPRAHFVNNLVASRVDGDRRLTVFNREFTIRHPDGTADKREVASSGTLLRLLAEQFGLHLPAGTQLAIPAAPWPQP